MITDYNVPASTFDPSLYGARDIRNLLIIRTTVPPLAFDKPTGTLSIDAASATQGGYVTTGAQTFSGTKTIASDDPSGQLAIRSYSNPANAASFAVNTGSLVVTAPNDMVDLGNGRLLNGLVGYYDNMTNFVSQTTNCCGWVSGFGVTITDVHEFTVAAGVLMMCLGSGSEVNGVSKQLVNAGPFTVNDTVLNNPVTYVYLSVDTSNVVTVGVSATSVNNSSGWGPTGGVTVASIPLAVITHDSTDALENVLFNPWPIITYRDNFLMQLGIYQQRTVTRAPRIAWIGLTFSVTEWAFLTGGGTNAETIVPVKTTPTTTKTVFGKSPTATLAYSTDSASLVINKYISQNYEAFGASPSTTTPGVPKLTCTLIAYDPFEARFVQIISQFLGAAVTTADKVLLAQNYMSYMIRYEQCLPWVLLYLCVAGSDDVSMTDNPVIYIGKPLTLA